MQEKFRDFILNWYSGFKTGGKRMNVFYLLLHFKRNAAVIEPIRSASLSDYEVW